MITFPFLNDLINTQQPEWVAVVKKYNLTLNDLTRINEIRKAGKLEDEWFNLLYQECICAGLLNADKVFDKYQIMEGRGILKFSLRKRLNEDESKKQYKGD